MRDMVRAEEWDGDETVCLNIYKRGLCQARPQKEVKSAAAEYM